MTSFRARCREEEGASLVLALVFLALFGLAAAAMLGFTDAGLRSGNAAHASAGEAYALDGAVDGAINQLRTSLNLTAADNVCPEHDSQQVNGSPVKVTCVAEPGIIGTGVGSNPANRPPRAILTTGHHPSEGIIQASNAAVRIRGNVHSNATISNSASHAEMTVVGTVDAAGSCSGTIVAEADRVPPVRCATGQRVTADSYAHTGSIPGTLRALPSCAGPVVTFTPGWYNDAVALSAMTAAGGPCSGKLFHFEPGTYYFHFRNAGSHEWMIADANAILVGGTRLDASDDRPPVPGACDPSKSGVQFVFGGDSRVNVTSGKVELCATPSATAQHIAVYGLTSGTITPISPTFRPLATSDVTSDPGGAFLTPNNARRIDESPTRLTSDASLQTDGVTEATLSIPFGELVPAGSIIESATVRVVHREQNDINKVSATLVSGTTSQPLTLAMAKHATNYRSDETDVTAFFRDDVERLADFRVTYSATLNNGRGKAGTASLDGVELRLTYRPPGAEAQNGCITTVPYSATNGSTCAVIKTSGAQTNLVIQGTVYAPSAALDVALTNVSTQIFGRGVVARTLRIGITPAAIYDGATIAIPDDSTGGVDNRTVTLQACLVTASGACEKDAAGDDFMRLVSRVRFGAAASGGANPQVLSWDLRR